MAPGPGGLLPPVGRSVLGWIRYGTGRPADRSCRRAGRRGCRLRRWPPSRRGRRPFPGGPCRGRSAGTGPVRGFGRGGRAPCGDDGWAGGDAHRVARSERVVHGISELCPGEAEAGRRDPMRPGSEASYVALGRHLDLAHRWSYGSAAGRTVSRPEGAGTEEVRRPCAERPRGRGRSGETRGLRCAGSSIGGRGRGAWTGRVTGCPARLVSPLRAAGGRVRPPRRGRPPPGRPEPGDSYGPASRSPRGAGRRAGPGPPGRKGRG